MLRTAILPALLLTALAPQAQEHDLMWVPPLDTSGIVFADRADPVAVFHRGPARTAPSPALLVAREFQPRFGAAIALASRNVDVIDSSAASLEPLDGARELESGAATFRLPAADADSSRYVLLIGSLDFSFESRNMPRRYVRPTPPSFDPATGQLEPGIRKGYTEGAGIMNTLSVTATWMIRDNAGDSVLAHGTASGSSTFRRDARSANWAEAARELAKDVLRQTPFTPF